MNLFESSADGVGAEHGTAPDSRRCSDRCSDLPLTPCKGEGSCHDRPSASAIQDAKEAVRLAHAGFDWALTAMIYELHRRIDSGE